MDFNSFERKTKKGDIAPAYAIFGDEAFLVSQSLSLIKKVALKGVDVNLSLSEYSGKDIAGGELIDELMTTPLLGFGNRRLVIVEDASLLMENGKAKMKEYFKKPSRHAVLVLVSEKMDAWVKKLSENVMVTVECKKMKDYQLSAWLIKRVKFYKKEITPPAAKIVVDETGNNLALMENHIAKLLTYIDEREIIDERDVIEIVFDCKKQSIFELTEALANKDAAGALKILDRLIAMGTDFIPIIATLAWQIKKLWNARRIVNECKNNAREINSRLQSELKVNQYFLDKFKRQVGLFTEKSLCAKYQSLADADYDLKTCSIDPRVVVECLLVKLCK